jgi:hypothetical protein
MPPLVILSWLAFARVAAFIAVSHLELARGAQAGQALAGKAAAA